MLQNVSKAELLAELARRESLEKEMVRLERHERLNLLLEHREVLKLFLEHDRASCQARSNHNYHPEHRAADCNLCALENLEAWDDDVEYTFELRLRKVDE